MYSISFPVAALRVLQTDHIFSTCCSDLSLNLCCDKIIGEKTWHGVCSYTTASTVISLTRVLGFSQSSALKLYQLWCCCIQVVILHHITWVECCKSKQFYHVTAVIHTFGFSSGMTHAGVDTFINLPLIMTSICNLLIEHFMPLARYINCAVW